MLTNGRTDGRKIGRLYRTLLQAGATKTIFEKVHTNIKDQMNRDAHYNKESKRHCTNKFYWDVLDEWKKIITELVL